MTNKNTKKFEAHEQQLEVNVGNGLTIFVYESRIEPGRWVVELETSISGFEETHGIQHNQYGVPQIKVMINEAIVSNDGGQEAVEDL